MVKPLLHHTQVCYEQSEEKLAQEDREERFKQHLDSLQELVDKNNAFTLKFFANLEINMKEKIDNALEKLNQKIEQSFEQQQRQEADMSKSFTLQIKADIDSRFKLNRNLMERQNQNIHTSLVALRERFQQQGRNIEILSSDINNRILPNLEKIEHLLTMTENTKCSSRNLDSIVNDIDKKLSNHGNTIEMALKSSPELTSKLEVLGKKMDSILSKQADLHESEVDPMWFKLGSKYYYISEDRRVNWHVALETCRRLGGYLVTFESEEEFNLVTSNLETTTYWTSFNDISEEGKFVSKYSGRAAPYLKWGSGEPTNSNSVDTEDCVQVHFKENFEMNDVPCKYRANVICEKQSL